MSSVLAGSAFAQQQVSQVVHRQFPQQVHRQVETSAALQHFQTPAQQALLPYLKAHPMKDGATSSFTAQTPTNYVTTPNFGGYVNAPAYDARTTASLDTGSSNNGVVVELSADFDKDGKPDIAVLQQDGTMNILLNNGKGGLSAPVSYYNPNYLSSSVNNAYAVDVNSDGAVDIIGYDYNNNTMITWMNLGNGTFNAAITTPLDATNGYPNFVLVKDVTGDGKPDVIFTTSAFISQQSANVYLEVQPGKGDGTFAIPTSSQVEKFTVPASVQLPFFGGVAAGDIDGDGKIDLAIGLDERTSRTTGNYVVVTALGNGDGSFRGLGSTLPVSAPGIATLNTVIYDGSGVYLTDVNNDGKADVVADMNGSLYTALSTSSGNFTTVATSPFASVTGIEQLVFADLNGDGKVDLIAGGGTLGVYLGNGDGTFVSPTTAQQYIVDPTTEQGMTLADFNGDGVQDLAQLGGDYKQVSIFLSNGKGQLRGAPVVTSSSDTKGIFWSLLNTGKFAGSSYTDALFLYNGASTPEILTAVNDGKANFKFVNALAGGVPSDLQFVEPIHGDFNGDGKEDLVLAHSTGVVSVALSNGDGTFSAPKSVNLPPLACPVYYGAAGDINGDKHVDLIIPYGGDVACGASGGGATGYFVLLGNGDGTFAAPVFTQTGTELYSTTLADMNGDGNLDLIIDDVPFVYGSGFNVTLAYGNGDGTFTPLPNPVLTNFLVSDVAAGDINGDGKQDLVLSAEEVEGSNTVATGGILTMTGNGDGTFNSPALIGTGNFFYGMQVGDMNGDGNLDIVATLYSTPAQPKNYYGMVTLLGYGNGQFTSPYNQLESLASTFPQIGNFYDDTALDVMTQTGYGPALFIGQGASSISLKVSSASIVFGSSETLTAQVAAGSASASTPTGPVSFYDGTTLLGTTALAGGTATFTTSSLATGTHSITANYAGDSSFNPAVTQATKITVTALAPAFTLVGTPTTLSLGRGANGVVTLNLAANASFSGNVTLTCSGVPANATCTVNPSSVSLTAGQTGTATLVIGTTIANAAVPIQSKPWEVPAALVSTAMLFGIFAKRRKAVRLVSVLGLVMMFCLGGLVTGCSDGSKVKAVAPSTFTVQVTATAAGSSSVPSQSTSVNVTVQ